MGFHTCFIRCKEKIYSRKVRFAYLSSGENEKALLNSAKKRVEMMMKEGREKRRKILTKPRITLIK